MEQEYGNVKAITTTELQDNGCFMIPANGPFGNKTIGPRTVIVPADPIIWDSNTSYEYLTLVASKDFGFSYISKKDVPAGTPLENDEYWIRCASFSAQIEDIYNKILEALEKIGANRLINVIDFGADPTGESDSYSAIMDALNAAVLAGTIIPNNSENLGMTVYFPQGKYKISSTITVPGSRAIKEESNTTICGIYIKGDGQYSTLLDFTGSTGDGIVFTGGMSGVEGLRINGAGGTGIKFAGPSVTAYCPYVNIQNVLVNDCGEDGIAFTTGTYRTQLINVECWRCGGWGFNFERASTSLNLLGCYANACANGYNIGPREDGTVNGFGRTDYSTMNSCSCDGAEIAYAIGEYSSLTMNACGAEATSKYEVTFGNSVNLTINNFTSNGRKAGAKIFYSQGYKPSVVCTGYTGFNPKDDCALFTGSSARNTVYGYFRYLGNPNLNPNNLPALSNPPLSNFNNTVIAESIKYAYLETTGEYIDVCAVQGMTKDYSSEGTTDFSGIVEIRVTVSQAENEHNTITYLLAVRKDYIEVISDAGYSSSGETPYTSPSFNFQLNGNTIQANHVNTTDTGHFYTFSIRSRNLYIE